MDPRDPGEKMQGLPVTRATSGDGRWAYTLYGATMTPFVHALDTAHGRADARGRARGVLCEAMIIGAHAVLHTSDADGTRAFFRDTLGLDFVDAGGGWLIFALPPAEVAAHPADGPARHELYLMCDDIHATVEELTAHGATFATGITEERWGLLTAIELPGGGRLGLYQPTHPSPVFPSD